jgi:hypothetical protein
MGNNQLCCSYQPKDQHAQNYDDPKGIKKNGAAADNANDKFKDAMAIAKKNEKKILKLQAVVRGFLQRKVNKLLKDVMEQKNQSNRSREKVPSGNVFSKGKPLPNGCFARELKEMPDHSNFATRATEARLRVFKFDGGQPEGLSLDLIDKGPFEMDNGAIFHG